jgi:hypothetical protein
VTCVKCRFYRQPRNARSECLRHAPQPLLIEKGTYNGSGPLVVLWPDVGENDSCGEFQLRDEEKTP